MMPVTTELSSSRNVCDLNELYGRTNFGVDCLNVKILLNRIALCRLERVSRFCERNGFDLSNITHKAGDQKMKVTIQLTLGIARSCQG